MQIQIGVLTFSISDFLHTWDSGYFNRNGRTQDVVEGLVSYIRSFEDEPLNMDELKEENNCLETENDSLRGVILDMEEENQSLKNEIEEYTRKWDGVERRNQDLEEALEKIDSLENTIYTLENRIKEMEWMH